MKLRDNNIRILKDKEFDVLIIGGGINGAVSAAALSAKGAKVALIEKKDYASFTSQESSNLIWGGIKYLESLEFNLVYNLCRSRNQLIKEYPSTIQEIRFLTIHEKTFRWPKIFLYLGTLLYWIMGAGFTRLPFIYSRKKLGKIEPIIKLKKSDGAVEYSDAYLHDNDARFVFGFIRTALNQGCIAANYVEAIASNYSNGFYKTDALDIISRQKFKIKSKAIINAAGPLVDDLNRRNRIKTVHQHIFSKGIHLIVDKITDSHKVLAFFADDGRLFFAIPMGPKTCIGTTDTRVEELPGKTTEDDRMFVLDNINSRLKLAKPLTKKDIIAERCGVRPLVIEKGQSNKGDWIKLSRKHEINISNKKRYISIFGGKLTDCLNIAEEISEIIAESGIDLPYLSRKWFGEPDKSIRSTFLHQANLMDLDSYTSTESSEPLSVRLWRRYGIDAISLLDDIRQDPSMAELIIDGAEYIQCEIYHAAKREMVVKLEDLLRRRSKIALITSPKNLKQAKGLKNACKILFGNRADIAFEEYFHNQKKMTSKHE